MELSTLGFPASYSARVLSEPPQQRALLFERPSGGKPSPGMLVWETPPLPSLFVEIWTRNGTHWIGEFKAGLGGISGIFATPNEDTICVISRGEAYLVDTLRPERYSLLPVIPVKLIGRVPGRDLLFLVDYIELCAVSKDGLVWRTRRVSWDGIKILEVTDRQIRGEGWDAPTDTWIPFTVDVETGHVGGGPNVPH